MRLGQGAWEGTPTEWACPGMIGVCDHRGARWLKQCKPHPTSFQKPRGRLAPHPGAASGPRQGAAGLILRGQPSDGLRHLSLPQLLHWEVHSSTHPLVGKAFPATEGLHGTIRGAEAPSKSPRPQQGCVLGDRGPLGFAGVPEPTGVCPCLAQGAAWWFTVNSGVGVYTCHPHAPFREHPPSASWCQSQPRTPTGGVP